LETLRPSSLKAGKTSSKRNLLEAIVHQTPMGRIDHSSHQAHSPCGNQSSESFNRKRPYINNRPFQRAPSQGKPYLGGVNQRLASEQKSNKQHSQAPNRNYMQGKQR